ncbi:hypothetical protein DF052_26565 [Burkholderia glumae]|nr:hypothetical protein DF052_26565 [Burkholderia glumae]
MRVRCFIQASQRHKRNADDSRGNDEIAARTSDNDGRLHRLRGSSKCLFSLSPSDFDLSQSRFGLTASRFFTLREHGIFVTEPLVLRH